MRWYTCTDNYYHKFCLKEFWTVSVISSHDWAMMRKILQRRYSKVKHQTLLSSPHTNTRHPTPTHPSPSPAYMRQWNGSVLVQIMASHQFGAKPLSKAMLIYCQLDSWKQISVKLESEFYHFILPRGRWVKFEPVIFTCNINLANFFSHSRSKQGKSEGFHNCDWPIILTQIGFKPLILRPVWPWNYIDDIEKQ